MSLIHILTAQQRGWYSYLQIPQLALQIVFILLLKIGFKLSHLTEKVP